MLVPALRVREARVQVKRLALAFDAFCMLGLALAALLIMLLAIPMTPYFLWKWMREERRVDVRTLDHL